MTTKTITLSGGFHNASPITARIKDGAMSAGQYKRLDKHMCGVDKCICGWRGYDLEGDMTKAELGAILMDTAYAASAA